MTATFKYLDLTGPPPPPRPDRDWFGWELHGTWLSYPAYPYPGGSNHYSFDIANRTTSAEVLDIIMQVDRKLWATAECVAGLVHAFNDILQPQANLCSGGTNKHMTPATIAARCKPFRKYPRGRPGGDAPVAGQKPASGTLGEK
jgi:hypothetical protein